jgi:predicted HicB family RNase H-like nuclease
MCSTEPRKPISLMNNSRTQENVRRQEKECAELFNVSLNKFSKELLK